MSLGQDYSCVCRLGPTINVGQHYRCGCSQPGGPFAWVPKSHKAVIVLWGDLGGPPQYNPGQGWAEVNQLTTADEIQSSRLASATLLIFSDNRAMSKGFLKTSLKPYWRSCSGSASSSLARPMIKVVA